MKLIRTEDAVGQVLCHDITQISPGQFKGARFRKGHIVQPEDIPVLLSIGKENLYVWEKRPGILHEDEAAALLYKAAAGRNIHGTEPKEGKIELVADCDGLLKIDRAALLAVNRTPQMMIAAIHGEIKAAYRHAREINRLLSRIRFSDSVYQIEILPAQNENGQFYEMLTAKELDSKVMDNQGYEGQMSLLEDDFYQKYEQKIQLLTEKFMPPREEDASGLEKRRQEMERYADYRNYLTFSMYEKVENPDGSIRKNPVDEMAGRDSGGEGQNPKYVALLAGFAMR